MKKLKFQVILCGVVIFFISCCGCGNYKYTIQQGDNTYFTNSYTKSGDCISFTKLNNEKSPMIVCGTYTIEENKDYKPESKK